MKPKSPPYRGAHIDVRWQDKNEAGLAARAAMPRTRPLHPCIAITVHAAATTVQKRGIIYAVGDAQARFIRIKSASKKRSPTIVNLTVKRRYLTERRAADGLCPQAGPLRATRRNHDPCRLSPRSASLGGLRPAMATDRAIRRPPARSPRQKQDLQRASNPR